MVDTCHHVIDGHLSVVLATTTIYNTKSIRSGGSGCNDQVGNMGGWAGVACVALTEREGGALGCGSGS